MPNNNKTSPKQGGTNPNTSSLPSGYDYKRLESTEATAHFNNKSLLTSTSHYDVLAYEHAIAFTVAGMTEQDLLQDTYALMQQAIKDGLPFNEFKKQLMPQLTKKGWLAKGFAHTDGTLDKVATKDYERYLGRRLKTIYHTGKQTAYAAGRWQRIQNSKERMPYLQYMPSLSTHQRDDHKQYYGLVRPVDDPIWTKIYPPNGFGCKCWVKQLSTKQAEKIGISKPIELETDTIKNPHTGKMIETTKGVHFSFNHNFDRLSALLKVAQDKHSVSFSKQLADKVVTMDTIAERFLTNWIGDKKDDYKELYTKELAKVVKKHKLSEVEFMALRHYTEANVTIGYRELNALLNQTDTVDWQQYLGLMSAQHMVDKALQKMPIFQGTVIRTANFPKSVIDRFVLGDTIDFRGLTSTTHGNKKISPDGDYNTVLTITSKQGRLIEDISRFENEKEVLFGSFSEFEVRDIEKIGNETHIMLVEVGDD